MRDALVVGKVLLEMGVVELLLELMERMFELLLNAPVVVFVRSAHFRGYPIFGGGNVGVWNAGM